MSARVAKDGTIVQLDARAEPDEVVTAEDAADDKKVARLFVRILRELAAIRRRWHPRRATYHDIAVAGSAMSTVTVRLEHGFGGRVNWWVVDWDAGTAAPGVKKNTTATTSDTLVLTVSSTGNLSIAVEAAG